MNAEVLGRKRLARRKARQAADPTEDACCCRPASPAIPTKNMDLLNTPGPRMPYTNLPGCEETVSGSIALGQVADEQKCCGRYPVIPGRPSTGGRLSEYHYCAEVFASAVGGGPLKRNRNQRHLAPK